MNEITITVCGGKMLSEETRQKISKAAKGRSPSPEARKKMSESQRGRKHSILTREKMSESIRLAWARRKKQQGL